MNGTQRLAAALLATLAVAARAQGPAAGAGASAGPEEAAMIAAAERGSVRAMVALAELRAQRGDLRGTAEPLRRALAVAPNSERVLAAYARASLAASAPGAALLALEPLARMHPTVPEYSYLLGVAWIQLGDGASAGPPLERARELEPRRVLTLAALGIARNQQKRFAEAAEVLEQAARLAPDAPEVLAVLAEAEEGLGNPVAAERHARRALVRAPRHPTALVVLGMVHLQLRHFAEARTTLEAAVASAPDSTKAHYQLSLACARLGDQACAAREVELSRQAQLAVEERLKMLRTQSLESGEQAP